MPTDWIEAKRELPRRGVVVYTKIHDSSGCRNEWRLKYLNGLWAYPDGSMYVYYEPTHWRYADAD